MAGLAKSLPANSSHVRQRLDAADQLAASGFPVPDTVGGLDFLIGNIQLSQSLLNPLQIMLEPVCNQNGFAVDRLYQIFQCIQLSAVNGNHRSGIVIHCTICQLGKFVAESGSVGSSNLGVLHLRISSDLNRL